MTQVDQSGDPLSCGTDQPVRSVHVNAGRLVVGGKTEQDFSPFVFLPPLILFSLEHPHLLLPLASWSCRVHNSLFFLVSTDSFPSGVRLSPRLAA